MTEEEFEVLDQLYFVTAFSELKKAVDMNEVELVRVIHLLIGKAWVKCYNSKLELISLDESQIKENFQSLSFLATKAGLMAHNQR